MAALFINVDKKLWIMPFISCSACFLSHRKVVLGVLCNVYLYRHCSCAFMWKLSRSVLLYAITCNAKKNKTKQKKAQLCSSHVHLEHSYVMSFLALNSDVKVKSEMKRTRKHPKPYGTSIPSARAPAPPFWGESLFMSPPQPILCCWVLVIGSPLPADPCV